MPSDTDSHDIEGRGQAVAGRADVEVGGRVALDYRSARSVVGRAPAEVASAIVGVTIFGVAGLLVGLLAVGAVLEDGAPLVLVLVPVMLAFGVGVWANARAIVRKRA